MIVTTRDVCASRTIGHLPDMDPMDNDPDPARDSEAMRLFVQRVQSAAGLRTESEADVLCRATLRHLGEQISDGQAAGLSAGLPGELAGELTSARNTQAGGFDKDTFVDQVSAHVHSVDAAEVEKQVHAVLSSVRAWSADGQVEGTLGQLPPDLATLFS